MDLDTTRSRSAYERIIRDFQHGETNLLVGTQMVTKGLDFGGVSVVGIINADQLLNQCDFRAHDVLFKCSRKWQVVPDEEENKVAWFCRRDKRLFRW